MNAAKRYGHISYLVEACPQVLKLYPEMTVYVLASDFDRVTAERDALQLSLNAADQRIDELTARHHSEDSLDMVAPSHEIPGTSGMRLNMLANQGE